MHRKDSTLTVTIATVSSGVPEINLPSTAAGCASKDCDISSDDFKIRTYPFAVVLRIRVLQVVCGISSMVMGTVGFIEEKGELNLGLGIPAGAATVLAAGASIHTTRGFGGYKPSSCSNGKWLSRLRFLGPSIGAASALTCLWTLACLLHITLLGISSRTVLRPEWVSEEFEYSSSVIEEDDWNCRFMAAIICVLSVITVLSVLVLLRVDCVYDPD